MIDLLASQTLSIGMLTIGGATFISNRADGVIDVRVSKLAGHISHPVLGLGNAMPYPWAVMTFLALLNISSTSSAETSAWTPQLVCHRH